MHASVAQAQRCEDKVALEVKTVTVDGVKGNWLPATSMNRVHFVLTECVPTYERLIASQARLLDLQDKQVKTASAALAARAEHAEEERSRAESWKQAYADARAELKEEREANSSVWRSPVLWWALGVAAGAGVTVAITYAVKDAVETR